MLARFLRIYPAFAVAVVIETFVIVPIFYEAPISDYVHNWMLFHLKNLLLWPQDPYVPHVFTKLSHPVINGSLWTIPLELTFYMALVITASAFSKTRVVYLFLFAASLAASTALRYFNVGFLSRQPSVFNGITIYAFVVYSTYFWAGVCAWKYREHVQMSAGGFVVAIVVLFASRATEAWPIIHAFSLPYIVIYVGVIGSLGTKLHNTIGDLSYGIYLFGYPTTNCVVSLTNARLPTLAVFALATPVIALAAYGSWTLIERKCLAFKSRHRISSADSALFVSASAVEQDELRDKARVGVAANRAELIDTAGL